MAVSVRDYSLIKPELQQCCTVDKLSDQLIAHWSRKAKSTTFFKRFNISKFTVSFSVPLDDMTLVLSNVDRRQGGIYQCMVHNSVGAAYTVAQLDVVPDDGKLSFPEERQNIPSTF